MERKSAELPRKRPLQERARSTVDAILMATAHILKDQGFEGTSTNKIAKLAGVSIGSLYQYFPNKESIVGELRERHSNWFGECLSAEIARIAVLPVRDAVRGAVSLLIALHLTDLGLHNALVTGNERPVEAAEDAAFHDLMVAYLEAHRDELRPMNLELVAFIALRSMEASIHGAALDAPDLLRDPAFADELTRMFCGYIEK